MGRGYPAELNNFLCIILDGTENFVSEPESAGDNQPETGASTSKPDEGLRKDITAEINPNETGWLFFNVVLSGY